MSAISSNHVRQFTIYNGICRQRLEEWATNATSRNNNPTTRMNGTTQLFITYPCSKAYYEGELGDGLRENFATYQDYLDACMVLPYELDRGIMRFRSGKKNTERLIKKRVLKRGVEICPYMAALKAHEYTRNLSGFESGDGWLGSLHEMSLMMRDITTGTSKSDDVINLSLKKAGLSTVSSNSYHWSSSIYDTDLSWYLDSVGFVGNNYRNQNFRVAPITYIYISNNSSDQINTLKSTPSYGDIFISVDNKKKFISAYSDKSFIDQYADKAIGVVYDVNGKNFSVVAGVNNKYFP